jgi:hypothetical protein
MKFRKKPVVIEAIKWIGTNWDDVCDFLDVPINGYGGEASMGKMPIIIKTLEGKVAAQLGDWIIKGVKGEFYPVKDEIFQLTYEPLKE